MKKKSINLISDITQKGRLHGVIDREGNFYRCGYTKHNDLEYDLIEVGVLKKHDNWGCQFAKNGWLKLTEAMFTECEFVFDFEEDDIEWTITDKQIEAMILYKTSHKEKLINFNYNNYLVKDLSKLFENGIMVDYNRERELRIKT